MVENVHEITVSAPAVELFDLVADVQQSPQWFPTHLHNELVERSGSADVVDRYVIDNGSVRSWRTRLEMDRDALRIGFAHYKPKPPLTGMRGEWSFRQDGGPTHVRVTHSLEAPAGSAGVIAKLAADLDRHVPRQLAQIKLLGARLAQLRAATVSVENAGVIAGTADLAFQRALAGETADEQTWQRVCLAPAKIVCKRINGLDARTDTLTGEYRLTERAGAVDVLIRRTVTLKPPAGEGALAKVRQLLERDVRAQLEHLGTAR
jgi:ribosome-associated toxin RatA of RatAB toxin-antitoxin module